VYFKSVALTVEQALSARLARACRIIDDELIRGASFPTPPKKVSVATRCELQGAYGVVVHGCLAYLPIL